MSPRHPPGPLVLSYAAVAYASFLATTAWAVAFLADSSWPPGIDHGEHRSALLAIGVDLALLLLFALQHTVMARAGFKRWLTRRVPPQAERSTFVLATSAVFALLFWQWQPIGGQLWELDGDAAVTVWVVCAVGWAIAISSTHMIDHLDFLGLRPALRYARGTPDPPARFLERWLYTLVRHPMMLGLLVAFWATPHLTVGHALFAAAASGYVAVGLRFEERDLRRELGDVYDDYAARVPAVVPRPRRSTRDRRRGAITW